jgi:hypothetical protein
MFWPGKLDQPHALHYLPDLARALVMPADSEASWGRAWNLPSPKPLTGRQRQTVRRRSGPRRPHARSGPTANWATLAAVLLST